MKLIRFITSMTLVLGLACTCTKFDDSALWQAINKNAADIAALKEKTNNLNSDIIALQQLVAALQNRDYITNCTPLADGTGYTVAFNSGKSIVVRNGQNGADGRDGTDGKDGKDGSTPQIGVAKDTDGVYYWTLNGSWLLDAAGNKVKAEGRDGGQVATPQLKILEGYWYVSTDGGETWTNLGKATGADGKDGRDGTDGKDGKDGESFFKDVIVGTDSVTFVLADGTTIVIPLGGHENTFEMVDLGLPSGIKWASCNLGASKPEEYGGYYQWGGLEDVTDTSIDLDWGNCPYQTGSSLYYSGWTKYIPSNKSSYWSGVGTPDNKTVLDPEDDVAHVTLGGNWRMPTNAEWNELLDNCTSEWTTLNGVSGRKFTSKKNGSSIFLPAAGYRCRGLLYHVGSYGVYWSSSLNTDYPNNAFNLYFSSDGVRTDYISRYDGRSVRPVYGDRVRVTGVSISNTASLCLEIGKNITLSATITPANATEQSVSWSSNNTSVATVDQSGKVTAVKPGSATITVKTTDGGYTATCSVTVKSPEPAATDAVDLGLSVKWASCNLGASKPEEYGGYYQWAGTTDVTDTNIYLDWDNCPYLPDSKPSTGWTKYIPSNKSSYWSGVGTPDNKIVLDPEDDVADVKLGGNWRMPTVEEWNELINTSNCSWIWTTINGIKGYKVQSKKAGFTGNWIFLPAAGYRYYYYLCDVGSGYYWSSSLNTDFPFAAYYSFLSIGMVVTNYMEDQRFVGRSVRPVYDGDRVRVTGVSISNTASLCLEIGKNITLSATITPANATEQSVSWSSNNTSVATVDQSGKVTAVKPGSATITVKTTDGGYTATCSVTVKSPEPATPDAVDLGLSVKWASCNLGASKPEEYGGYYQWGGLQDVTYLDDNNCPYHTGSSYSSGWTKYNTEYSYGTVDNKTVLDPEDDVAHVKLGGNWRMPTVEEWFELINTSNCSWIWTTINGINGYKVQSKKAGFTGNWIFLPAAGYRDYGYLDDVGSRGKYWSSSLGTVNPGSAYYLGFDSGHVSTVNGSARHAGLSVRPVSE